MEFLCLGTVEAMDDGVPVELGEPQRRLVLALLLTHANTVVSTDRFVDGIWGDEPPASGRKIVQGYVSGLRKALGDGNAIESRSPGYILEAKPRQVDAARFEELAADGARELHADPNRARGFLDEALALWRGDPYEDLADFDVLRPEITRLGQLRLTAIENRLAAVIYTGNAESVVDDLGNLTDRHPLRERLWSLRMLALYRCGRPSDALRAYDDARRYLASEVGLEPSVELQLVRDRVLQQDPILDSTGALAPAADTAPAPGRNPYKGLRAFDEADADDFHGREALVRRLREAMGRRSGSRLVVLAGASGSGKSSVVNAGLVPALRADEWSIAAMYPGASPMESLGRAVASLDHDRSALIVDQLEEITVGPDGIQEQFLDALAELATADQGPWVVATIRADFLDRLLLHPKFAPLVEPGLLLVTPLEDHEVREVIVAPASRVGTTVEPDLVAAMVRDVAHRAPALPLLEYALTDLYDRVGGGLLTLEALEAAGGISGALAKRADELYLGLDDPARLTARQLFLRMVNLTDEGEALRRRVPTESLSDLPQIDDVLDTFGAHRLITFDRDHQGEPSVEVAHEALLREWPRLDHWIDDAWDSLRMRQRLADATAEWEAKGRPDTYLLSGARLAQYADWPDTELALSSDEHRFLVASREREDRERSRRRARRTVVLVGFAAAAVIAAVLAIAALIARSDAADNAASAEQNEALAYTRELAASAVAVRGEDAELSMLLALEAIDRTPSGASVSPAGVLALRESLQQHRLLSRIPGNFEDVRISPDGATIFVSSEQDRSVKALDAGTGSVLWTFQDPGARDAVWSFFSSHVLRLSVSPDGKLIAVSIPDHPTSIDAFGIDPKPARVVVLDAETGDVVHTLVFEQCRVSVGQGFTPDGEWLVVGTGTDECVADPDANWAVLIDTVTWEQGPRIHIEGNFGEGVSFSADGTRVLVHDVVTNNAELRSFPDLELINQLPEREAYRLLSSTGMVTVVGSPETDRRRLLVDAESGDRIAYLDVDDFITGDGPRFSPDGSAIAVPTRTHDYVFDARNGELLVDLGNTGITNSLDFTVDGSVLVTAGPTGVQVWDITGRTGATGTALTVPGGEVSWLNPNVVVEGQHLAVSVIVDDGPFDDMDATMTLVLDPATGSTIDHVPGDSLQLPDGRFVVGLRTLGTEDRPVGPLVVLDPGSGSSTELDGCVAPLADLVAGAEIDCPGPLFSWYGFDRSHLVSSVDESYFVATSYAPTGSARTVRVWDSDDFEFRSEFVVPHSQEVFAAGPTWVAATTNPDISDTKQVTIYEVDSGAVVAEFDFPGDNLLVDAVNAVTNDGSILLVADADGFVLAFDTSSWEQVARWHAHDALIRGLATAPEGARLATTGQDDLVKIWDLSDLIADGSLIGAPRLLDRIPADFPSDAAWLSPDRLGVFLADAVQYITVSLRVDDLVDEATRRLTRSFTAAECALYQIKPCPTLQEMAAR